MKFFKLVLTAEKDQQLRLRRVLMALGSYLLADIVVVLYQLWGLMKLSLTGAIILFSSSFVANLFFIILILSGSNKRWKDPSLTIPQMVVAILFVFVVMYHTISVRGTLFIFFIFTLTFGFFRLTRKEFFAISTFIIIGYCFLLILFKLNKPEYLDVKLDILRGSVLTVTVFWFSLIGGYQNELKKKLKETLESLNQTNLVLKELATTDELTKINNRREIFRFLDQEIKKCRRYSVPLAIVMVDLDYFKSINDTYGHNAGDEVLKEVAWVLKSNLRESDNMGRFGGEEFLIVLPNTDARGAFSWAERARETLRKHRFKGLDGLKVTASFGVAGFDGSEESDSLLRRADKGLYQAKQNGRDRVELG